MKQDLERTTLSARGYGYRVADPAAQGLARELVDRVYSTRLQLAGPEGSATSCGAQQVTAVALQDGQVVATLTLQSHAFARGEPRIPLELEALYDLESSPYDPRRVAEVRRVASLPGHGQGVRGLYRFAAGLSLEAGIHAWLGLVEARGSRAADAALVHRVARAHGIADPPSLPLRSCDPRTSEWLLEDGAAFTLADLENLPLPGHIASFARSLGARAVGIPALHPAYCRLVLPMRAALQMLATR